MFIDAGVMPGNLKISKRSYLLFANFQQHVMFAAARRLLKECRAESDRKGGQQIDLQLGSDAQPCSARSTVLFPFSRFRKHVQTANPLPRNELTVAFNCHARTPGPDLLESYLWGHWGLLLRTLTTATSRVCTTGLGQLRVRTSILF